MSKKDNLIAFKNDLLSRRCEEVHLIWSNGQKAGIGNPKAIDIIIKALLEEIDKQINEL
jgi:hypothetical protein